MNGIWTQGAGFPSAVLRFAAHIPLGTYMNRAGSLYAVVRDHEVLQQPPYNPNVLHSLQIAAKWSKIAFYWNFALWIPNAIAPNILVIIIGAFDIAATVHIALTTALQAGYVPHSAGACRDAETWQIPDNGTESFFHMVGTFNETAIPAKAVCEDYYEEWKYSIVSLVIFGLTAACNFIIGMLICICFARREDRSSLESYKKLFYDTLVIVFTVALIPFMILAWLANFVFVRLPVSWQIRIRYMLRISSKATQRGILPVWVKGEEMYHPAAIKLRTLLPNAKSKENEVTVISPQPDFSRLLNYDILVLVSQHLHFTDMVNLSLVSKTMRETIFPKDELRNLTLLYKKYTCDDESKELCWTCRIQICKGCDRTRNVESPQLRLLHLENCAPYCENCYFNKLASRAGRYEKRACRCRVPRNARTHYGSYRDPQHDRRMCTRCYDLPPKKRISIRKMHEKVEMRKMRGESFKCHGCALTVSPTKGPRWWVCKACNSECRSHLHPPWS